VYRVTGDRAAASQQRVLELMHRVSGYTLRVSFRPGRLLASLAVSVIRFPGGGAFRCSRCR